MAAVLCNALCVQPCIQIGRCCSATCNALDECCEDCNRACAPCCNSLCETCCYPMGRAIGVCCAAIAQLFEKPYSCFAFWGTLLNFTPILAAIIVLGMHYRNPCDQPLTPWLIVSIFTFLFNIIFAIYMFFRMNSASAPAMRGRVHFDAYYQFLMYDVGFAIYIVAAIFNIAWAITGLSWRNKVVTCNYELETTTYILSIASLVIIGTAIVFSTCRCLASGCDECCHDVPFLKCICCCVYYPLQWLCCLDESPPVRVAARHHPRQAQSIYGAPPVQSMPYQSAGPSDHFGNPAAPFGSYSAHSQQLNYSYSIEGCPGFRRDVGVPSCRNCGAPSEFHLSAVSSSQQGGYGGGDFEAARQPVSEFQGNPFVNNLANGVNVVAHGAQKGAEAGIKAVGFIAGKVANILHKDKDAPNDHSSYQEGVPSVAVPIQSDNYPIVHASQPAAPEGQILVALPVAYSDLEVGKPILQARRL